MLDIHDLGNKIISVIKEMIDERIIMCDTNALIIASTDKTRIGDYHEGAHQVIQMKKLLIIDRKMVKQLKGVKTGINLPLFFNDTVIGVIGISGDIEKVKPFGEIVRKMTELLINENYYKKQIELEQRTIENFVFEWLHHKKLDKNLIDRAKTLNLPLTGEKQAIIMTIKEEYSMLQNDVLHFVNELILSNDILVRWGNNRLLWIHHSKETISVDSSYLKNIKLKCEQSFNLKINIGVGQTIATSNFYLSYEQALIALKYSSINDGVCFYSDLYLELCLQDISEQTKKEFINRTISRLNKHTSLLETLKVFFAEELSYQKTANKLFIHINTLHYRLSRIEEITHFNPRKFSDLIILYLATLFSDDNTNI